MSQAEARNETTRSRFRFQLGTVVFLVTLIGGALSYFAYRPTDKIKEEPKLSIVVTDTSGTTPIQDANVTLSGFTSEPRTYRTDAAGTVALHISSDFHPQQGRLFVEKEGYLSSNQQVFFSSANSSYFVALHPKETPTLQDRIIKTFSSPPVPSGTGANFSGWYEVTAEPPSTGYVIDIQHSYFFLRGDRQCNAWSECVWKEQTPQKLSFQFRLQGHNEWPPPGQAFSQGFLHVEYMLGK